MFQTPHFLLLAFVNLFPQVQFIEFVRYVPVAFSHSGVTWCRKPNYKVAKVKTKVPR